jgi:hypothetical protein
MIVNTTLSKSQQDKLKKIMKSGTVGKLRLTEVQLKQDSGPHFLKLSTPQTKKVVSSINRNKGVDLVLTKAQLQDMMQEQDAGFFFLPFLIAAAELAGPAIASAAAGFVADKAISAIGNAIFGGGLEPYKEQEGQGLQPYKKQTGSGVAKKKTKKKTTKKK